MAILQRFNRVFVIALVALALGFGLAAVNQTVNAQRAEAFYITIKVSPSSEHSIRVSDLSNGYGIKKNVAPGKYSHIAVQSVQVDSHCELYKSGSRIAKRKSHDWWYNFSEVPHSKTTLSLKNCRSGTRGDVVKA